MINKNFRISLKDEKLFPVQAFFNVISDDSFVNTLKAFSNGVGANFNDTHCEFPGDIDFDDEPFDGVRFALFDDEVILTYQAFLNVLQTTCKSYIDDNPKDQKIVYELLQKIEHSYNSSQRGRHNGGHEDVERHGVTH